MSDYDNELIKTGAGEEYNVYSEPQLREKLIRVKSKMGTRFKIEPKVVVHEEELEVPMIVRKKVNGEVFEVVEPVKKKFKWVETKGYRIFEVDLGYKEPLSEDLTTAAMDMETRKVCEAYTDLLGDLISLSELYDIDLSVAYNHFCDRHNALVVSSKSGGEGIKAAIRQYVEQKRSLNNLNDLDNDDQTHFDLLNDAGSSKYKKKGFWSGFR